MTTVFKVVNKRDKTDIRTVYHCRIGSGACRTMSFLVYDWDRNAWTTVLSDNYEPYEEDKN